MREKQVGYHVQLRTPRSREQCKLMGKSGEVHPAAGGMAGKTESRKNLKRQILTNQFIKRRKEKRTDQYLGLQFGD